MEPSPFLLSPEEQEEENRAQLAAFAEQQQAAIEGRPPANPKAPRPPVQPRPFSRQPFATGTDSMMNHGASGAYHAAIGSAQQGRALGNMIAQTMDAHQDENDSRVSQEREYRRMMHEQEIERMRQETERMKIEAMLERLDRVRSGGRIKTGNRAMIGPGETHAFPGGSISYV